MANVPDTGLFQKMTAAGGWGSRGFIHQVFSSFMGRIRAKVFGLVRVLSGPWVEPAHPIEPFFIHSMDGPGSVQSITIQFPKLKPLLQQIY